jgi:DNA-binding NtrC family response regulator
MKKGAFYGSMLQRRTGKLKKLNGGTLSWMKCEMNSRFSAEVIAGASEKEITRIGSNQPVKYR